MPDTQRGDFGDVSCSDCGDEEKGLVFIKHWGPLIPAGDAGLFGPNCWVARMLLDGKGKPRPLGTPYEHRENLMDDWDLMMFGYDEMRECGEDKDKLRDLLTRVDLAKQRFAGPRQMFDEASRLRDIERGIQSRL